MVCLLASLKNVIWVTQNLGAVPENNPWTGSYVDCPGQYGQVSHRRKVGQVLTMGWGVPSLRLSKTWGTPPWPLFPAAAEAFRVCKNPSTTQWRICPGWFWACVPHCPLEFWLCSSGSRAVTLMQYILQWDQDSPLANLAYTRRTPSSRNQDCEKVISS